jgi:twitching motility protein PilT
LELAIGGRAERFRVNYFLSGEQMGACFRLIPAVIPDFQWAGFPEDLARQLAHYRNGLVLICGVVGSGKSTSLAMLINQLNQEGGYRIITV